jgi:hypothetical protein
MVSKAIRAVAIAGWASLIAGSVCAEATNDSYGVLRRPSYRQLNLREQIIQTNESCMRTVLSDKEKILESRDAVVFNQIPIDVVESHPGLKDAVQLSELSSNLCGLRKSALPYDSSLPIQRVDAAGPLHDLQLDWSKFLQEHNDQLTKEDLFRERDRLAQKYSEIFVLK